VPRISTRRLSRVPSTSGKSYSIRIAETYERLGVTEQDVSQLPVITHILNELPGKAKKAVEFLRGSSEPEARKWLAVYDSLPVSSRGLIPFEAYCLAANLTTKRVLELITGACFEQSGAVSALIAKSEHPAVVKATVRAAKKPDGDADRKMLHLHEGFVPVPKTSVLNIHGDVTQDNRVQSISIGELTSIEGKMSRIANRFNERMGIGGSQEVESREVVEDELEPNVNKPEVEETAEWEY
jgi:hypothetical protein